MPKLNNASALQVNRVMSRDRYFGLNFGRLLQAANRCSCGAATFGCWDECECGVFDSATVEWRVFNASTKPETIHAWLLLSAAMTAHAMVHPIGTLPIHAYGTGTAETRWDALHYLVRFFRLQREKAA